MTSRKNYHVSIVIPAYNEESGIVAFHNTLLMPELEKHLPNQYEVIYVNDGSTDDTLKKLTNLASNNPRVKVINLSRNFGKEIATTAGISRSTGDAVIIIDADGQHPPKIMTQFIDKWLAGAQVVVGVRKSNQKEGVIKKVGSKLFYRLMNSISDSQTIPRSTDYRLIDKHVRDEFLKFTERDRITRGLIDWLGFRREYIEFDAPARIAGEASYTVSKLTKLAVNSFTTLSLRPLFIFSYIGAFITLVSLIVGIFILIEQFILGDPLALNFTGAALLGIFVSFLVGIVLVAQGIMSIYLSHIHTQMQNRPLFVIDTTSSVNLDKDVR